MRSKCSLLLMAALLTLCSSCVRIEIGDDTAQATLAQQLTDLAEAKRAGAVSDSEFREIRRKLLNDIEDKVL